MQVVDCGTFYDGTGDETYEEYRIVIEDGQVTEVGPSEDIERATDATHLDYSANTIIPGLVDTHVHIWGSNAMDPFSRVVEYDRQALRAARATTDLRKLIEAGFTTVRDMSSDVAIGLRDAVDEGTIQGPRIFSSGQGFSQTAGHGDTHYLPYRWIANEDKSGIVDGPTECRRGARLRIREGADLIKISSTGGVLSEKDEPDHSQFTPEEIQAFTEEAHRVGIPVAAHAQGAPGIKNALRNGVDTIEHGIYLDDECIELFHETEAVMVPTLAIVDRIVDHGEDHGIPPWGMRKARAVRDAHIESTRWAFEEGIHLAAGTDFIGPGLVPHGENVLELELYVDEIGMTPIEAIHTATGATTATLPVDDIGTLTPGSHADFLVLDADPTDDISVLRDGIVSVFKGGEPIADGTAS